MTTDHTAPELLEAVGVDWRAKYARIECPECHMPMSGVIGSQHLVRCRRPSTRDVEPTYTGPALGTPELDALLLVAGQRWLVAQKDRRRYIDTFKAIFDSLCGTPETGCTWSERTGPAQASWSLLTCHSPGHVLARAIRKVQG